MNIAEKAVKQNEIVELLEGKSDYQKNEKLAVVRTNLETFSSVLEEEGEDDDILNIVKTLIKTLIVE